jgi:hypothetical protein
MTITVLLNEKRKLFGECVDAVKAFLVPDVTVNAEVKVVACLRGRKSLVTWIPRLYSSWSKSILRRSLRRRRFFNLMLKLIPWVYYLNIPKKYIAGPVYDSIQKEIIKGFGIPIDISNGDKYITKWMVSLLWFEGLKESAFSLSSIVHVEKSIL